ncbi:uncharacterized protein BO96DRAFT_427420 [Aspergillus niger CBS 101883]|uniref:uncharacterized protein n=1 Tax=Aspergillus lacticoffeatus (strain CBS 101883) TaxID=1450533 RepID=UPI000D7FFBF1|nr:uncharacterized protein BO96DRAFT_427420 [Aspergillus niger CBS 101883]PYH51370.1 hypothetical protein BO96DRAFT_427420 [Aspergillus niger CBS 101883]
MEGHIFAALISGMLLYAMEKAANVYGLYDACSADPSFNAGPHILPFQICSWKVHHHGLHAKPYFGNGRSAWRLCSFSLDLQGQSNTCILRSSIQSAFLSLGSPYYVGCKDRYRGSSIRVGAETDFELAFELRSGNRDILASKIVTGHTPPNETVLAFPIRMPAISGSLPSPFISNPAI